MDKRWFWGLVIALHFVCFGKQLFFQTSYLQDSREYLFAADNLLQHYTLYAWDMNEAYNPNWLTKRPFLYPAILSAFKLLSFGSNHLFIFLLLFIQNLISIYILKTAENIVLKFNVKINYLFAFLLVLFTPSLAIYANFIMSEIWLGFTLILLLQCLLFYENTIRKVAILALLCMIASSLKPVMIFSAFCLPFYSLYVLRFKLRPILISLLPALLIIGTSFINQSRTGYYHYSSISNINLLKYNAYTLLINKYGITHADSVVDAIQNNAGLEPSYTEAQRYINYSGRQIISSDLGLYAYLHARGILLCLLDPGRFDITQFFNIQHKQNLLYEINKKGNFIGILQSFLNPLGLLLMIIFLFNLLKIYFGIKFLFMKTIPWFTRLTMLFFPAYILLFTGPIGSSRFAMPFFPILLVIILIAGNSGKLKILH